MRLQVGVQVNRLVFHFINTAKDLIWSCQDPQRCQKCTPCIPILKKHAGAMQLHAIQPGPRTHARGTGVVRSPVYLTAHLHARPVEDPFENEVLDDCRGWGSHSRVTVGRYAFIRVLEKAQGKQLHLFYCLRHFLQLLPFLRVTNPSADPAWPCLSCKSWQDHSPKQYSHRLNTGYQNVCLVFSRNAALKIYNTSC